MNVYRCVDRQKIESYLNKLTYQLIADVVEEKCTGMQVAEEHKEFIAGSAAPSRILSTRKRNSEIV